MSIETILTESQDMLLGSGDGDQMTLLVPDVIRTLARQMPVFGEIQVTVNTWDIGTWTEATGTFTRLATLPYMLSTTTANDGVLLGGFGLFERIVFLVQVPHTGDPVYEYTYWNGDRWQPLALSRTPDFGIGGLQFLVFLPPSDWQQAIPDGVTFPADVVAERFWIRIRATTAPLSPIQVNALDLHVTYFVLPPTALQLLSAHYYPYELEPASVGQGLDTLNPYWRASVGLPLRYTQELETTRRVRLVPSPIAQGTLGIPPFSGVPGADPTDSVILAYLEAPREDRLPEWFEGLVVLGVAAREAAREGETQDMPLATSLQGLLLLVLSLLRQLYADEGEEIDMPWSPPWRLGVL